jgi:hypothetical protein
MWRISNTELTALNNVIMLFLIFDVVRLSGRKEEMLVPHDHAMT